MLIMVLPRFFFFPFFLVCGFILLEKTVGYAIQKGITKGYINHTKEKKSRRILTGGFDAVKEIGVLNLKIFEM